MSEKMPGQTRHAHAGRPHVAPSRCTSGLGPGSSVFTARGIVPVDQLLPGDRVITFDRGAVRLSALFLREMPAHTVIRVRPAALDAAPAVRDFLIAAQQTLLIRDWRARAMFGKRTALVEAGRLVDGAYLARLTGSEPVALYQLVFANAQHVVQLADGRTHAVSARLPHKAHA